MRLVADHVRVRVPATSANLGPGFDSLGLALALYDDIEVRAVSDAGAAVEVHGEGAADVPRDEEHLVVRALRAGLDHVGASQVGLRLVCTNRIPHGRGLGSSAAAVVAGLFAARAMIAEPAALDDDAVLRLATAMEGHPDNAAPAVLGGAAIAWTDEEGAHAVRVPVHADLAPVLIVPPHTLSTRIARGVLPARVPHADAAFGAGRAALLVEALGRRLDLLMPATEDRLHQEYRRAVMPQSMALVGALRQRGAAAVISGAGPSVLVLARRAGPGAAPSSGGAGGEPIVTDADEAVAAAFGGVMAGWRVLSLAVALDGGLVERASTDR